MRVVTRALATTVAGLALTTGAVVAAAPASAAPVGPGCVGLPSVPAAYVCVVSIDPANAVPNVTTTNFPVQVPAVCYYVDCTDPTTVNVPVPGYSDKTGYVAVITYNGQTYSIGAGVGSTLTTVTDLVTFALGAVNDTVNGLPSTQELYDTAIAVWYQRCGTLNTTIHKVTLLRDVDIDCYFIA
jgi:hypothetical protein